MSDLKEKLAESAEEFSRDLEELCKVVDASYEDVVRKTALDLFGEIIKDSPVDTGSYKASHGIKTGEPTAGEGIVRLKKGQASSAEAKAREKAAGWRWKLGDGDIFLFNEMPYAEPLENGHSQQAPKGIYRQAMAVVGSKMRRAIVTARFNDLFEVEE